MSDTPSFMNILNKPAASIEAPKVLPAGRYLCMVDGPYKFNKVGKNETDCVDFNLKPTQPIDVDPNLLAEALNGASLFDRKILLRLFVTEDSAHRLKKFLHEDLGIPLTTFNQMLPEAINKEVIVQLTHRPSSDGTQLFQEVKKTEPKVV
jgi:hypothetical protein